MSAHFIDEHGTAISDIAMWARRARGESWQTTEVQLHSVPGWREWEFHKAVVDDFGSLVSVGRFL